MQFKLRDGTLFLWFLVMGAIMIFGSTPINGFLRTIGISNLYPLFGWFELVDTFIVVLGQSLIGIALFLISILYFRRIYYLDLLRSAHIVAAYTFLMVILNKCFGEIGTPYWLDIMFLSIPSEWCFHLSYLISGHYGASYVPIWGLLPSVFAPYIYVLVGHKIKPSTKT